MRSTESGFNEIVYVAACQERIRIATQLLNQTVPDYVMATYLSGVAVECLFHAYRIRAGAQDDAKHDLFRQAELGNFFGGMKRRQKEAVGALLGEVVSCWQNNHRYRSADALKAFVIARRLHITGPNSAATRDDPVKHNAERIVDAANELVTIGITRWTLS